MDPIDPITLEWNPIDPGMEPYGSYSPGMKLYGSYIPHNPVMEPHRPYRTHNPGAHSFPWHILELSLPRAWWWCSRCPVPVRWHIPECSARVPGARSPAHSGTFPPQGSVPGARFPGTFRNLPSLRAWWWCPFPGTFWNVLPVFPVPIPWHIPEPSIPFRPRWWWSACGRCPFPGTFRNVLPVYPVPGARSPAHSGMFSPQASVVVERVCPVPGARSPAHSGTFPPQASVVVERVWPVPLGRAGAVPRLQPRRHRVFRLLRDGKHRPRGDMELLLSRAVQDLGGRGDVVSVRKSLGRNKLLAQGLAVYPSPENLRHFQQEKELAQQGKLDEPQTLSGQKTLEFLRRCRLEVGMKNNRSWELSPDIVARHFLKNVSGLLGPFWGFGDFPHSRAQIPKFGVVPEGFGGFRPALIPGFGVAPGFWGHSWVLGPFWGCSWDLGPFLGFGAVPGIWDHFWVSGPFLGFWGSGIWGHFWDLGPFWGCSWDLGPFLGFWGSGIWGHFWYLGPFLGFGAISGFWGHSWNFGALSFGTISGFWGHSWDFRAVGFGVISGIWGGCLVLGSFLGFGVTLIPLGFGIIPVVWGSSRDLGPFLGFGTIPRIWGHSQRVQGALPCLSSWDLGVQSQDLGCNPRIWGSLRSWGCLCPPTLCACPRSRSRAGAASGATSR
uniref:Large ribosomal subunit protein bL9m n=1 Tax=Taeniopygia guttata TaxID=59729 RepID=A0A674HID3_TAEGU